MSKIRGNTDAEYELAVRQGNIKRLQLLAKNKIPPPKRLMLYALKQKHPELLHILKKAGADPNDLDGFNDRALGRAIREYSLDVVKGLLDLGADPNLESSHLLPLVWVAYDDKIEYVKILLDRGANPNLRQWNGVIPLHAAVRNGQPETVRLFLKKKGNPKIKGPDKRDSIQLAKLEKQEDVLEILKQASKKHTAER